MRKKGSTDDRVGIFIAARRAPLWGARGDAGEMTMRDFRGHSFTAVCDFMIRPTQPVSCPMACINPVLGARPERLRFSGAAGTPGAAIHFPVRQRLGWDMLSSSTGLGSGARKSALRSVNLISSHQLYLRQIRAALPGQARPPIIANG